MNLLDKISSTAGKIFAELHDTQGRHLTPFAQLAINGRVFGTEINQRIISIELTDKRGFEADELTIELNDYDGAIAIPQIGDIITLSLGYQETGVVEKGEFKFAEFTHQGAPDTLSLTARAADLAETLAEQKEKSWHKQTLFQIVETIAQSHGYTGEKCKISPSFKYEIPHIDQTNESDISFLSRLAEDHLAIATVKNGVFLFIEEGVAETASGEPIPEVVITRQSGDRHSFSYDSANAYNAVKAFYTDKKTGKKMEVIVDERNLYAEKEKVTQFKAYKKPRKDKKTGKITKGKTTTKVQEVKRNLDFTGRNIKTVRKLYASEKGALSGARSLMHKLKKGAIKFSMTLAMGRPDLYPETPVTVVGFKPELDKERWLITEVQHRLDDGGYTCSLNLESRIDWDSAADDADETEGAYTSTIASEAEKERQAAIKKK